MKTKIDIETWIRKDHFKFFSQFEEPFFGVTVKVDCTKAYQFAKAADRSFFLYYLYRALKAANAIDNFAYRIIDGEVYQFNQVNISPTINRPNGTFGFAYIDYYADEDTFYQLALVEIESVKNSNTLMPSFSGQDVIHCSAMPWLDFTSLSHARSLSFPDSCPKISFGKMTDANGVKTMPVSIHVHHGLADGFHVAEFVEKFQHLLDSSVDE